VNFGGYRAGHFFVTRNWQGDRREPDHRLPWTPPPSGSACGCPHCATEGWYAQSPACNFWRATCGLCDGTRRQPIFENAAVVCTEPCDICQEAWHHDVAFFREALTSPQALIRRLREEAAAWAIEEKARQERTRELLDELGIPRTRRTDPDPGR
jgi:hypothetical protein